MSERVLVERHDTLIRIVNLATDRFDGAMVAAAAAVLHKVDERLRHGTSHTVVALAGPTGSGKSSLFNAIIGEAISATSVRRPTTGQTHAAVFGHEDAGALLDWLEVDRRHLLGVSSPAHDAGLDGLVLLLRLLGSRNSRVVGNAQLVLKSLDRGPSFVRLFVRFGQLRPRYTSRAGRSSSKNQWPVPG